MAKRKTTRASGKTPLGKSDERAGVRPIRSWVNQLLARRGYAQVSANEAMASVVSELLGENLKDSFQIGNLKSGKLHIYVSDSVMLQELNFRKREILDVIQQKFPDSKVKELRFRIQAN